MPLQPNSTHCKAVKRWGQCLRVSPLQRTMRVAHIVESVVVAE
eukprot:CAMPEP_0119341310 /NCGR_PEP_ID=MMETSP1333-20130426/102061_1 /TAXON_ID=418940 /ORGANISM="Scyphosphaera apsteinii, Strain RCC1455" /LENGTH=42 /DNA_ID= /DNA_START= /DNA_END= /DNA_ORIENTATION=